MLKKPFEFKSRAREVMLEHLPPMGTGSRNEENLVLDSLALYNSVLVALHDAWAAGRDMARLNVEKELMEARTEGMADGRQEAMDTVDEWHKDRFVSVVEPTGGEDGEL